ncbi:MAG: hypothetical protein ACKVPX_06210 [Myxococcaceae bacterium]
MTGEQPSDFAPLELAPSLLEAREAIWSQVAAHFGDRKADASAKPEGSTFSQTQASEMMTQGVKTQNTLPTASEDDLWGGSSR